MRRFKWQQWAVLAVFVLSIVMVGVVGTRTVRRAVYWRHHRDETIRPWMSVPHIAHSYRVPPDVLYQAIGLPPGPPRDRRPLREIARQQHRDVKVLIDDLQNAITQSRLVFPPPPPPPPPGDKRP